jgi:hypothetical protein
MLANLALACAEEINGRVASPHHQHAHHQFRIDRWSACVAVERGHVLTQFTEIKEAINPA